MTRTNRRAWVSGLAAPPTGQSRSGLVVRASSAEIAGIILLLSSFTWNSASIEEYQTNGLTSLQLVTRVAPLFLCTTWLFVRDARLDFQGIRGLLKWPALPIVWYAIVGSFSGFGSSIALLSIWKGCELTALAYWSSHARIACEEKRDPELVLRTLLTTVCLILVYVLVAAMLGLSESIRPSNGPIPILLSSDYPRINANGVGVLSAFSLYALASGKIILGGRWLRRSMICVATITLVMAQSRTAYVGLAIVLLISLSVRIVARTSRNDLIRFAVVLVIMGVALVLREPLTDMLMRSQDLEGILTLSGRTYYWDVAVDAIENRRWIGGGHAVFSRSLYLDYPGVFRNDLVNVHNAPLEALLGAGILGALPLVLAYLALPVWVIFRAARQRQTALPLAAGLGILLLMRMSTSIAPALFSPSSVLFLAAAAGMVAAKPEGLAASNSMESATG
jgi:O-antigen ligase